MKKHFLAVLAILSFAVATPAFAEGENMLQAGVSAGSISVKGSPISVNAKTETGANIMYARQIQSIPHTEFTLGLSQQRYKIGMGGSDLNGGPSCTTASATGRYRFMDTNESMAVVYVGGGLYTTSCDSASYAGGILATQSANMAGPVAEIGVRVPFSNHKYYVDLNARQYYGSTGDVRLEVASVHVPVTNIQFRNPTAIIIAFGGTF